MTQRERDKAKGSTGHDGCGSTRIRVHLWGHASGRQLLARGVLEREGSEGYSGV